jgi:hypothetical protein
MGSHPANLAIRFMLELVALVATGIWGWYQGGDGWLRFILAAVIPISLMVVWGLFAVPDDPSRSGNAPVPVPGIIRLLIELSFFGFAVWALYDLGFTTASVVTGIIVVLHYAASYDRIMWLMKK